MAPGAPQRWHLLVRIPRGAQRLLSHEEVLRSTGGRLLLMRHALAQLRVRCAERRALQLRLAP